MITSTQWQLAHEAAERYEQILVPAILGPFARALVDWSDLKEGETVLDVGCGTGEAARHSAKHVGIFGRVIGLDINPAMLEVARSMLQETGAPVEWQQGNADQIFLPDGVIDVIVCAQTLQFLKGCPTTLAEMHRVLKSGGRATFSLWCNIGENPYFDALVQAITRHIDGETAQGLGAAFQLTDPGEIHALLAGAGFKEIRIVKFPIELELPPMEEFVPRHVSATPMSQGFKAASTGQQNAVIDELALRMKPFARSDHTHRVPFVSFFARGVK